MIGRKRQGELVLQVVLIFREGIDLPSQPSSMLAYCQVVALHSICSDRVADRRRPQGRCDLLGGPVDDACGDMDHPTMRALFDDHRVAQVGWRVAAGFRHTPTCPLPWWCVVYTIHLQQSVGIVRQGVAGEEWNMPISRRLQ